MPRLSHRRVAAIRLIWIATALVATALPARAGTLSCTGCHDKALVAQFTECAHAQAGLTCVDCHGGDPKAADEKAAHAPTNFSRPKDKRAIAELCAKCHSDVRKMNPYGLPTDQLDRYKTSKHGEQLYDKNDQKVAVCTDCHGVHDIQKVKSPQSHVHPTHVPDTCGRCHSNEKLMAQYSLPADVVAKYKTSHHANLLYGKGDLSAPTCVTCHGNHGATPPGTKEVGQVCGKCHGRQRELFEKSPHAEPAALGLFSECVSCHGNHAIQKASLDLFAVACVQCHKNDKKQLSVRDAVAGVIRKAGNEYQAAASLVRTATVRGLATDEEQLLLQEAKTQVTQLEALQHTLTPTELQPAAARATDLFRFIRSGVAELEQVENWKRRALIPVWLFLVAMAGLFWLKRKQVGR